MKVLCVVVVVVMGVVATQAAIVSDDIADVDIVNVLEDEPEAVATGRTFHEWGKTIMSWMGYDYDDYDYDDYEYTYYLAPAGSGSAQLGYGIPSVGYVAPSAGGPHSSYSSYSPVQIVPQQHFAHTRDDVEYDDEWSISNMLFNAAMAAIPVGVLLAALPTGIFPVIVRRRSFEDDNMLETIDPTELPLLQTLMDTDLMALTERQCQAKLFCELYRLGEHENASLMQKAFYYVATLTPDFMARRVGLAHLFRASRAGMCDVFHCSATSGYEAPPKIDHHPTNTNHVSDLPNDSELDATQANKE